MADSILLIDDKADLLRELAAALEERRPPGIDVEIQQWVPSQQDEHPHARLEELIDNSTALVITDHDLTGNGLLGLFGTSIVSWCQEKAIPVGDFSRGNPGSLPREPDLFELRVPIDMDEAADFVMSAYLGFAEVRKVIGGSDRFRSPAAALAAVVGKPRLESQLALYVSRLGATNSALVDRFQRAAAEGDDSATQIVPLLSYIVGHVLLNSIMRFPGPLLSSAALCAYVSASPDEADALAEALAEAAYDGPFSGSGRHYWRDEVEEVLRAVELPSDQVAESHAAFNKAAVQQLLSRDLVPHGCERCGGMNGGFWCPFTKRAVCERGDCSVAADSWIPRGADLSRIERDFYEEWEPVLGW